MTKDFIVCRCEGVYLSEIERAIEEGAASIPGLKIRTRSGMGMCQGRVCQSSLRCILQNKQQESDQPIVLQNAKFPVRPVSLEDLTK
ncbi:(2Fe-2S)-binding protein [Bacillus sp. JJ1562]|uniref:(2Fe-2S)-binding protein n=1 Tax=Bacillus sp. JJ1562 TaxID=3122960 RepID=UPI0030013E89